ncbi:MAG: hypothetical protein KME32_12690 [Mojavia pulchra JT2-VF2]|uniref:Uncharacterized protein n=1 Tax=Mojavia pulchra JT2-VF2 TaxID=287848 RepID=A0A951PZT5_9NOST|nr:hypothetical protein [Mojavia pulchra JT2-VF2]
MRLPIVISAGLLLSLSLNPPAISQSSIQTAQSPAIANSNFGQLKTNRRLWKQQRLFNYRYTLSRSCFCTAEARGPVVVEVRNGRTTSITSVATGKPVDPELFKQYSTLAKLFNVIEDAIAKKASSLTVQYNPQLGYPTQINIDYSAQMADEELYLTIEKLEKIK